MKDCRCCNKVINEEFQYSFSSCQAAFFEDASERLITQTINLRGIQEQIGSHPIEPRFFRMSRFSRLDKHQKKIRLPNSTLLPIKSTSSMKCIQSHYFRHGFFFASFHTSTDGATSAHNLKLTLFLLFLLCPRVAGPLQPRSDKLH